MLLTPDQIDAINREREMIRAIIRSKPEVGRLRWVAREEACQMIIRMHNIEMNKTKKSKSDDPYARLFQDGGI